MSIPRAITPIIKLTEACNYSCSFCRYANHPSDGKTMSLDLAMKIIKDVVIHNKQADAHHTSIIFHGGEPLLWGLPRFKEVIAYEQSLQQSLGMAFHNSIQTNGALLSHDWIEFFKNNRFSIGVSLDGPSYLNSHYGPLGKEESLCRVLKNLRLLDDNNISYGVLSVITNEHYGNEQSFYKFFTDNGIKNIGLCYCFNPDDGFIVDNQKLSSFLIGLFDLYFYGKAEINIREFNDAIRRLISGRHTCCTNSKRASCGSYISITPHGEILFCDEYDLKKHSYLGDFSRTGLENALCSEEYTVICNRCQMVLDKCKSCSVNDVCGSGCARNDIDAGNYFWETYKRLFQHIKNTVLNSGSISL